MNEGAGKGPGAALRSARESHGISPEDVAGAMHLPVGIVRSLEENAFDALPGPTFTRGYIRSYARLLGLDGNVLIREYGEARGGKESQLVVEVAKPSLTELPQRHPGRVFGGAVLAVALAGSAVLWWAWPQPQEVEEAAVRSPGMAAGEGRRMAAEAGPGPAPAEPFMDSSLDSLVDTENATAGEGSVRPGAAPRVEDDASGEAPAPETDVAAEAVSVQADAGETGASIGRPAAEGLAPAEGNAGREVVTVEGAGESPASPERDAPGRAVPLEDDRPAELAPFEPPASPIVAGSGGDVLELAFEEDCWVEVFDREDRVVHMDMSLGGQSLRLRGDAPFSVRLGNASAAVVAFNGAPVDLGPHTRANVANLVLGN